MRLRRAPEKKGSAPWIVTFSDLMTLILVFFIMLFAMSELDVTKFKQFVDSYQSTAIFDGNPSVVQLPNPAQGSLGKEVGDIPSQDRAGEKVSKRDELEEMLKVIEAFLEENELGEAVTATRDERGVVLVLQERILFRSGEATIIPDAIPFLDRIGELLQTFPNIVKVEGHTDNRPISNYRYPSNWELSGARASVVIRYFIDQHHLDPKRFVSVGYGEYQPVATNETIEGRQENRRVVILISDLSEE